MFLEKESIGKNPIVSIVQRSQHIVAIGFPLREIVKYYLIRLEQFSQIKSMVIVLVKTRGEEAMSMYVFEGIEKDMVLETFRNT